MDGVAVVQAQKIACVRGAVDADFNAALQAAGANAPAASAPTEDVWLPDAAALAEARESSDWLSVVPAGAKCAVGASGTSRSIVAWSGEARALNRKQRAWVSALARKPLVK